MDLNTALALEEAHKATLTNLTINEPLTKDSIKQLMTLIPKLKSLETFTLSSTLPEKYIVPLFIQLTECRALTYLNVTNNIIYKNHFIQLIEMYARFKGIIAIDLSNNCITDLELSEDHLKSIGKWSSLVRINFAGNSIDEMSLRQINIILDQHRTLNTKLLAAIKDDNAIEKIDKLISRGAEINVKVEVDRNFIPLDTPLHLAVRLGYSKIVAHLLKNEANSRFGYVVEETVLMSAQHEYQFLKTHNPKSKDVLEFKKIIHFLQDPCGNKYTSGPNADFEYDGNKNIAVESVSGPVANARIITGKTRALSFIKPEIDKAKINKEDLDTKVFSHPMA